MVARVSNLLSLMGGGKRRWPVLASLFLARERPTLEKKSPHVSAFRKRRQIMTQLEKLSTMP
jgi:hypothetical protein